MTIRKGTLYRKCHKCGQEYKPTGKYNRLCPDCLPNQSNSFWRRLARVSEKKKKLKKNLKDVSNA